MNSSPDAVAAPKTTREDAKPQREPGPSLEPISEVLKGLRNRHVIVTGGAHGTGAQLVAAFVAQGAVVGFIDQDEAAGHALAAQLSGAHFQPGDLSDVPALLAGMATLIARLGGLDVLVNSVSHQQPGAFEAITQDSFDQSLAINLRSHFFAIQAALGPLRESGGGAIVNVMPTLAAHAQSDDAALLALAQAAIGGLAKGLAPQLMLDNIRINTIVHQRGASQAVPLAGQTSSIAHLALLLAADASLAITAQEFVVAAERVDR